MFLIEVASVSNNQLLILSILINCINPINLSILFGLIHKGNLHRLAATMSVMCCKKGYYLVATDRSHRCSSHESQTCHPTAFARN